MGNRPKYTPHRDTFGIPVPAIQLSAYSYADGYCDIQIRGDRFDFNTGWHNDMEVKRIHLGSPWVAHPDVPCNSLLDVESAVRQWLVRQFGNQLSLFEQEPGIEPERGF